MIKKSSDQRDLREPAGHLIAPNLATSGELGLIVVGTVIAIAYILTVRPATGLSLFEAAGFALLAFPGAILALLICGQFFSRLSLMAGVILVLSLSRRWLWRLTMSSYTSLAEWKVLHHYCSADWCLEIFWLPICCANRFYSTI